MRGCENVVLIPIYQCRFSYCITTPKQKYNTRTTLRKSCYRRIGKLFPSMSLM